MPLSQAQVDELRVTSTSKFETQLTQVSEQIYKLFTTQDTFGSEGYVPVMLGGVGAGQEWVTSRVMRAIKEYGVKFTGKLYENSVKLKNTQIADAIAATGAKVGAELAKDAAQFSQEQIEALLRGNPAGFDAEPVFGEHSYSDAAGAPVYSNDIAGQNSAWFLLNEHSFVEATRTGEDYSMQIYGGTADSHLGFTEDAVAMGWRARKIFAPGFWANSVRSKAALTSENLRAAMTQQAKFKNDAGKRIGARAQYLVVGHSNAAAAERLIKAALVDGGNTNVDLGRLQLIVLDGLED